MRKIILFLFGICIPLNAFASQMCVCTETIPLDLEITALYPSPLEDESEWVEITNNFTDEIDLSYYTLEDTTAKPQNLSGTLKPKASIKISDLSFQLNNGGDAVTLKTVDGEVVDQFSYTSSSKGIAITKNTSNEEPAKETSQEVELTDENLSTPNLLPEFSEALPNPEGSDSTEEWIELYNPHDQAINLSGLKIDDEDGGSSPYKLEGTIQPESYMLISIEDSKITLNNTTDSIRLLGSSNEVLWEVKYENPTEGMSYALILGNYVWTDTPTPNYANTYTNTSANNTAEESETDYQNGDLSDDVEITEAYPNPEGPDQDEEWVEITNGGSEAVNLGNWTLDDGEGGSDPYVFPDDTVVEPGESIVVYRTESEIALNNSEDSVRLSDYTGEIVNEISYESSVEGESYSKIEVEEMESTMASTSGLGTRVLTTWLWTSPSPGAHNPSWLQFKGKVVSFNTNILSLFDGINTWELQTENSTQNTLIFQPGNLVLIKAMQTGDIFTVMNSELLESALPEEKSQIPWGVAGSALLAISWISYEIYKKRKSIIKNAY